MPKIKLGITKKVIVRLLPVLLALAVGIGATFAYFSYGKPQEAVPKNKYLAFSLEVYDKIQENYWDHISDQQLAELYQKAAENTTFLPLTLKSTDRKGVEKMIEAHLSTLISEEEKKHFVVQTADVILANLPPFGRSRLFSEEQEKELRDTVSNISETDHYEVLGVEREADLEQIESAYRQREEELIERAEVDETASQELAQIREAKEILGDTSSREVFDQFGANPTVSARVINNQIFYLHLDRFSPTSLEDINREAERVDNYPANLDTFIFDLRENIGGAIDGLPYFLGPFIGNDNYAYRFFRRGETTDFKTKMGWLPSLVRYKKVIILVNENTQSTAEVMADVLKKYNVGILLGTITKGWGTIENVFKLENQLSDDEVYSMFLVHSLTLRQDGLPIEDNGVSPLININSQNWEEEFYAYIPDRQLIEIIKEVLQEEL